MVDSGSSASLVTERMAKDIEEGTATHGGATPRTQYSYAAKQTTQFTIRGPCTVIYNATDGMQGEQTSSSNSLLHP